MKLGIMQPYFFPYIGYYQLINAVDKYVIYDDVNFIKGGWINRNRILMNGEDKMINLQMHGSSPNKLINEVELLGNPNYNRKLLRTIENCYNKSPYFQQVFLLVENIINQDEKNMAKYLEYSIKMVCDYLSINTEIIVSSTINKNNSLKGQEKVIEICRVLGADEYINAIGGQELYSRKDFFQQNIKISFLKAGKIEYPQLNSIFVPNLSIIDVMMFNSSNQINDMLQLYELL